MALTFRILPKHNLVYVKYTGHMDIGETYEKLAEYEAHPDFAPGQRHFVDLSDIRTFETDHTKLMQLQAAKVELTIPAPEQVLLAYFAPNDLSKSAARAALRSWEGLDHVIPMMGESLDCMFDMLGLGVSSLDELLQAA